MFPPGPKIFAWDPMQNLLAFVGESKKLEREQPRENTDHT